MDGFNYDFTASVELLAIAELCGIYLKIWFISMWSGTAEREINS